MASYRWDVESGETLRTLIGHTDSVTAVAVTLTGAAPSRHRGKKRCGSARMKK